MLEACARYLPAGRLDASGRRHEGLGTAAGAAGCGELLARAQREGVAYMPGR